VWELVLIILSVDVVWLKSEQFKTNAQLNHEKRQAGNRESGSGKRSRLQAPANSIPVPLLPSSWVVLLRRTHDCDLMM
jgi:hypothetical protein